MASSDNFENTLALVAPAGGVTAGTMAIDVNTRQVVLPMTSATSGNTFTAKVMGRIKSAPVISTMTGVQGASIAYATATSNFTYPTTGTTVNVQGILAANFAAGGTTADIILDLPRSYVAP